MKAPRKNISRPVRRGMVLLLLFSVAGIAALVVAAGGAESIRAFSSLSPGYIALGLLLVVFDLFLGALRNHIFIRKIKPGTGFSLSFRANTANMFMGAITPSQGLGGPAQLAVLNLGGIPFGAAVSVSVLNFIGTILFFGVGVSAALIFFQRWIISDTVVSILWGCAGLFFVALVMLSTAIFKPSILKKVFHGFVNLVDKIPRAGGLKLHRFEELFQKKVDEYHHWCLKFLFKFPWVVIISILLTVMLYLNKFTISWMIALGLGLDVSWGAMFASLYLITFISYFAPSPGAGGVAEVATGIILSPLIPGGFLPLFTLLNRMFILFIPAGVGFSAVLGTLRHDSSFFTRLMPEKEKH